MSEEVASPSGALPREDKLRKRCEALLEPGEAIALEAEATVKLGYLSEFGSYRAYLTNLRLICIRRSTPILRPLLFWIPDLVIIALSSMQRVKLWKEFTRAWLVIETEGKRYSIRLGQGPYPMLRDNPETTQDWLSAIENARAASGR